MKIEVNVLYDSGVEKTYYIMTTPNATKEQILDGMKYFEDQVYDFFKSSGGAMVMTTDTHTIDMSKVSAIGFKLVD